MSEPRKLNTGDAQRTVYHADGSAPRNIQTDAAASQQSYEEARRQARAAAAAGGRRTRSFNRVRPSDVAQYQAERQVNAGRTLNTGTAQPAQAAPRTVHRAGQAASPSAQQPARAVRRAAAPQPLPDDQPAQQAPLTTAQRQALALQRQAAARQSAAAPRARVQRLDLSQA